MGTCRKDYTHTGAILRMLRIKHRETLKEQGERLGYSHSNIASVDGGKCNCTTKLMSRIVERYKLEPVDIVRLVQAIVKDHKNWEKTHNVE